MRSVTINFNIASLYFFLGLIWILFSDLLLTSMALPAEKAFFIQLAKGGAFVLATSLLFSYLVKRHTVNLQEREAYLSSILDSQTYFLIRFDLQGNYTFVNRAFCQKYGYQEKEIIGQSYEQYLLTEDHEKVKAMLQECSNLPGRIVELETHRYDRQGKRFTTS
jgi:PAS domain S-box-containing protein